MNKLTIAFLIFLLLPACAFAQATNTVQVTAEDYGDNAFSVYAGFINGNYDLPILNNRGVNVAAQYKLYGYGGVKLEAVADLSVYLRGEYNVYTLLAGPQVSVSLVHGRIEPFARILFGATRYDEQTLYSYSYGGGVDVNISKRFFVRPFQYDKQILAEGSQPVHRVGVGAGLRF